MNPEADVSQVEVLPLTVKRAPSCSTETVDVTKTEVLVESADTEVLHQVEQPVPPEESQRHSDSTEYRQRSYGGGMYADRRHESIPVGRPGHYDRDYERHARGYRYARNPFPSGYHGSSEHGYPRGPPSSDGLDHRWPPRSNAVFDGDGSRRSGGPRRFSYEPYRRSSFDTHTGGYGGPHHSSRGRRSAGGFPPPPPHHHGPPDTKVFERVEGTEFVHLQHDQVLRDVVHLGDTLTDLSHYIAWLASRLSSAIHSPWIDPRAFISMSPPDFILPADLKENSALASNISVIADVISSVALHLPTKSSVYATLVALWHIEDSRLPPGITPQDFGTLQVKVADDAEEDLERRGRLEVAKMKWWLANCLTSAIVLATREKIESALLSGLLMEAVTGLRFLCDLANCQVVDTMSVVQLLQDVGNCAFQLPKRLSVYSDALVESVLSVLPWLSAEKAEMARPLVQSIYERYNSLDYEDQPAFTLLFPMASSTRSLSRALRALESLEKSGWRTRTLPRLYTAGALSEPLRPHSGLVQHALKPFTLDSHTLLQGMEAQRLLTQRRVMTGTGAVSQIPMPDDQIVNVSVGVNGVWGSHVHVTVFPSELLVQLLNGVKPLEIYDQWSLEREVLNTLHAFRHAVDLCADVVLRIPIQHDQFEMVLVETVINEMLRLPHSAEPVVFYCRLLEVMCEKQSTLRGLIETALMSMVKQSPTWDMRTLDVLSEFFSYWLAVLPEGPASFDFTPWSPERIAAESNLWLQMGHKLDPPPMEVSLDDSDSQIQQQLMPRHLKKFLRMTFERLGRLLWPGSFIDNIPTWLVPYIPNTPSAPDCNWHPVYENYIVAKEQARALMSVDDGAASAPELGNIDDTHQLANDCPWEYILLRRLLVGRFLSSTHQEASVLKLKDIISTKLLGHPRIAEMPSDEFLRSAVGFETVSKETCETDPPRQEETSATVEIADVKPEPDRPSTDEDATMQGTTEPRPTPLLDEPFIYGSTDCWELPDLIAVFVRAVLGHGAKSLTHMQRLFEIYVEVFKALRPNPLPQDISLDIITPADRDYFYAILRPLFMFWSKDPLRLQWGVEVVVRLNIVPDIILQEFMLTTFPASLLSQMSVHCILMWLVRHASRRAIEMEDHARRLKRAALEAPPEDASLTEDMEQNLVGEATYQSVISLVVNALTSLCSRYGVELSELDQAEDGGRSGTEYQDIKDNLLGHLINYCRTFMHLLSPGTLERQKFDSSCADPIGILQVLQQFLYPSLEVDSVETMT